MKYNPYHLFITALVSSSGSTKNNNNSNSNDNKITCPITLEICLSPGCLADGSEQTLHKFKAIAPPNQILVKKGGCVSACGNGPIVRENEKIIHKRIGMKNVVTLMDKLLLSKEEGGGINTSIADSDDDDKKLVSLLSLDLIGGYDNFIEAETELNRKNYEDAITLYEKGIELGFESAISHSEQANDNGKNNNISTIITTTKGTHPSMEWIVKSYCGLAKAKLAIKDKDGTIQAAEEACKASKYSDPVCFELVAQICQEFNEPNKELKALQTLFQLPVDGDLSREVANRRRTQGFRLAKLEREFAQ
mmetsp:Transcript_25265/g.31131  ORF Transcript_25265/g.31131 Transcript_25265/m.31131 type:complete len:306 (+) Transcript_25265:81-998(+)